MAANENALIEEAGAAVRLLADDPRAASERLIEIRGRALRSGDIACASICARLLAMVTEDREWLDRYADILLSEDPSSRNYLAVASAKERVGLLGEALAAYERAAEIELKTNGDPEIVEMARNGCERLRTSSPET